MALVKCSFCQKTQNKVPILYEQPSKRRNGHICSNCVADIAQTMIYHQGVKFTMLEVVDECPPAPREDPATWLKHVFKKFGPKGPK